MRADATTATHETRCPSESAKVEPGEGCPVTGRKTIYLLGGVSRLNGGSASVIPSRGGFPRHLFRCEGRPVDCKCERSCFGGTIRKVCGAHVVNGYRMIGKLIRNQR